MARNKHSIFTQHARSWRNNLYVYPVVSRRAKGVSIGVNLNPDKACNFDCVYCCVDRTVPAKVTTVDMDVLRAELSAMLALVTGGGLFEQSPFDTTPAELRRLNDVAFSGDGEPTGASVFDKACRLVVELLAQRSLKDVKIVVITNATLLHRKRVSESLALLDQHNGEIWAKLDAGTEDYYRRIERTSVPLSRVLENIRDAGRVRPIVIQSLFIELDGQTPPQTEIAAYLDRLRELSSAGCQIRLVQVYTVARRTAERNVAPLPDGALDAIAAGVRKLDLPVETFYGPA